jgi:peptidoglycan hydrolase-like protein with peptidoglycan-binding domain
MRKVALVTAGALALPLAFSLPAVAQHLMEQAQDEGMRQAQAAGQKQLSRDQIKQAQAALDQKGFHVGRADGVVGRDTREALSAFQRQQKLQQTGLLDDQTLRALGIGLNAGTNGAATTGAAPSDRNQDQAQTPSSDRGKSDGAK